MTAALGPYLKTGGVCTLAFQDVDGLNERAWLAEGA